LLRVVSHCRIIILACLFRCTVTAVSEVDDLISVGGDGQGKQGNEAKEFEILADHDGFLEGA
jgi:hypothetical protein